LYIISGTAANAYCTTRIYSVYVLSAALRLIAPTLNNPSVQAKINNWKLYRSWCGSFVMQFTLTWLPINWLHIVLCCRKFGQLGHLLGTPCNILITFITTKKLFFFSNETFTIQDGEKQNSLFVLLPPDTHLNFITVKPQLLSWANMLDDLSPQWPVKNGTNVISSIVKLINFFSAEHAFENLLTVDGTSCVLLHVAVDFPCWHLSYVITGLHFSCFLHLLYVNVF